MSDSIARVVERIRAGAYTRIELLQMRVNAENMLRGGNSAAAEIIGCINKTALPPLQAEYVFMGFCPGADISRRQDQIWIEQGICRFDWPESKVQYRRFRDIMPGDTLILKKREKFGETMKLFAHGTVLSIGEDDGRESRLLRMDWQTPIEPIVVPLMGCNGTVDVRRLSQVEQAMPQEFWAWLGHRGEGLNPSI